MEKWKKFKEFINSKVNKQEKVSGKIKVYNAILTLYAGEEAEEVFSEMARLYQEYPLEVEFYIP